jgi:hypothetical protein
MPAGRVARPLAVAALAALALAGLAGCGSKPTPGSAADAGAPAASPSTPGCATAAVHVRLDTAVAGVAAGTYYVPLEFTNTSSAACALSGYPAVALTSGMSGSQIGTEAAVDRSVPAAAVTLAPGGTAHAWLSIASTASFPARTCKPVTAAGLRVVVPGSGSASYLADRVPACKSAVPGGGILMVHPVQPGPARRGTA